LASSGKLRVENGAVWSQSGGAAQVTGNDGVDVRSGGTYNLSGGTLNVTGTKGIYIYNNGEFEVGGTGHVTTTELTVGEPGQGVGHFAMTSDSAIASVSGRLIVGPEGTFSSVPISPGPGQLHGCAQAVHFRQDALVR
jgi:hypothetical protein